MTIYIQKDRRFDVFEFDYIRDSFKQPRHLGHLILSSKAWERLSGGVLSSSIEDPLTAYFTREGNVSVFPTVFRPRHALP